MSGHPFFLFSASKHSIWKSTKNVSVEFSRQIDHPVFEFYQHSHCYKMWWILNTVWWRWAVGNLAFFLGRIGKAWYQWSCLRHMLFICLAIFGYTEILAISERDMKQGKETKRHSQDKRRYVVGKKEAIFLLIFLRGGMNIV